MGELTRFVAADDPVQIIDVVVVVPGGAEDLEREVADDRRRPVVEEQELPLERVARRELALGAVHYRHLSDELRRLQPPRPHEQSATPIISLTRFNRAFQQRTSYRPRPSIR